MANSWSNDWVRGVALQADGKILVVGYSTVANGTLAELVKVDVETISRIERGAIVPSVLKLEQVASVLGLPLAELLRSSSTLAQDQSLEILGWLQGLSESDRQLVLGMIQMLCRRLVSV